MSVIHLVHIHITVTSLCVEIIYHTGENIYPNCQESSRYSAVS